MKRLLTIALGFLLISGAAFPQAGHIGLYSDAAYTDCELLDNTMGTTTVFRSSTCSISSRPMVP